MITHTELTGVSIFAQMLNDLAKQLLDADKMENRVEATTKLLTESELLDHADAVKLANLV